jgi:glycerophosphoryl diester phosphodiesterase
MARPVAHRGLHDKARGLIENSMSAARAAIAKNCAIECDIQLSQDGEAMVFHDFTLERLTASVGRVDGVPASRLGALTLTGSQDRIPTLAEFLTLIAGRVPLVCEIKSRFDGDLRLTQRAVALAKTYDGPLVFKSFDPFLVAALKQMAPDLPRGIVSQSTYQEAGWDMLSPAQIFAMENLSHWDETQPDFISWKVRDLRHSAPFLARKLGGVPVMTWTVRTPEEIEEATRFADQLVFENCLIRP